MKHKAIVALLNSGVNTLTGRAWPKCPPSLNTRAAQVERANASSEFVKRFKTITARTARSRGGLR